MKQRPTSEIIHSNWYQVRAEVKNVKSNFIQSEIYIIAERYDLYCFESDAEHLELIHSHLADNKHLFPGAVHVEGGVCSSNLIQRESNAANVLLVSILLPGGVNPMVSPHQISLLGK